MALYDVLSTISVGANPYGIAVTPNGSKVYTPSQTNSTVSVIDTATNTVTATVTVGSSPRYVAVNHQQTQSPQQFQV